MSPVARGEEAVRRQKEARQKKLLLFLAPVLVVLLAWQGPGMVKAFGGGEAAPEPSPTTTTAEPTTNATSTPASEAPPSTSTAAGIPTSAAVSAPLPDTDVPAKPGKGQLVSFDRFVGKDPFRQQVSATEAGPGGVSAAPTGTGPDGSPGPTVSSPGAAQGESGSGGGTQPVVPSAGTIEVNGRRETVAVSGEFPLSDPVFRLVSLSAKSARIGLVSGQFSSGMETITIRLGKSVTLVSQPDGVRYTVKLVKVT